jgi:hypothetical protein
VFEDATTKARQATIVSLLDKSDEEREKEAQAEKERLVRACVDLDILLLNFCTVHFLKLVSFFFSFL